MTKLILIAVLFFTANVAGAEVTYLCKYNSEGNFSEGIPECPPKMLFKEQPEAITVDKVRELCQDKCHLHNVAVVETKDCPLVDCTLNSSRPCKIDENGCPAKVESDAEKWRELCEESLKAMNQEASFERRFAQISAWANIATAYCTRFNGALLEEIRKELRK